MATAKSNEKGRSVAFNLLSHRYMLLQYKGAVLPHSGSSYPI